MFVGGAAHHTQQGPDGAASRSAGDCLPRRETVQDLRAAVAKIEERSRQLLGRGATTRVARSVEALAETARAEATAVARATHFGEGHTSADMFLAQLGYDVDDQLRLLRHIEATRPAPTAIAPHAADASGAGSAGAGAGPAAGAQEGAGASAVGVQLSVSAFLAAKRQASLSSLIASVQATNTERERNAAAAISAAQWEQRKQELAGSIGLRNLLNSTTTASGGAPMSRSLLAGGGLNGTFSNTSAGPRATAGGGSSSDVPAPHTASARRIAKFAGIVSSAPASEWSTRFANAAAEISSSDSSSTDAAALANLWTCLHRVLSFHRLRSSTSTAPNVNPRGQPRPSALQGSVDAVLRAVSASRCDLEMCALETVYEAAHGGADAPSLDQLRRMHPTKVLQLLSRIENSGFDDGGSSGTHGWHSTYRAMRCGRYDAAAEACPEGDVSSMLRDVAALQPSKRHEAGLTAERATRAQSLLRAVDAQTDPYRAAVLLILLAGDVGNDAEALKLVGQVVSRVATTLHDLLWFRMCLVRVVRKGDPSPTTGRAALTVQSLEDLQRQLLSDQQQLLVGVDGDIAHLADILIHALLFNTAVRMLADRPSTASDAAHMAVVLAQTDMLNCPPSAETPLDLATLLQRHVAIVARLDAVDANAAAPGAAAFAYFDAVNELPAFVELCASSRIVAVELFGKIGGKRGALLAGTASDGSIPPRLVSAATDVAEQAASNGAVVTAIDVLLNLHAAAIASSRAATATVDHGVTVRDAGVRALKRAVELLNPALCHCTLKALAGVEKDLNNLGPIVEAVIKGLANHNNEVSAGLLGTFEVLRTVASSVLTAANGSAEDALNTFFSLPFVPLSDEDIDGATRRYDEYSCDEVDTVMPRMLTRVVDLICSLIRDEASAHRLRPIAETLVRWHATWRSPGPPDVATQLHRSLNRIPA